MNKITIRSPLGMELETEFISFLGQLCLQIQKEFDIAPLVLSQMINNLSFIEDGKFLYEQCHIEMINNINEFKETFFNALSIDQKFNIDDTEYEKCGYLIKSYKNGYIQYCNLHKYLHPYSNMICAKNELDIDHEFVTKTDAQIIKEHYNYSIYIIYQNYVNKLNNFLKMRFYHQIEQLCDIKTLRIDENLNEYIIEPMKNNINLFKSKVIYEYINLSGNQESQQKHFDENKSYYYLKIYLFRDITV